MTSQRPPKHGWTDHSGCADAMGRLYTYLDGEMDEDGRTIIRRHLEECPPCLEAFDFEAVLRLVIARKCREPVPPSLETRISQVFEQELGTSAWQQRRMRRQF